MLGFSSQFTDYFAKRITKFLKPRYLTSLVFKIWKQTRSCRKQVVTSVQAWRNSPTWPVLPLSSGSEALPQGENLQRSEFNRSKCFHQPLPSGSLVRLRCWRPAPPVPQEYFRLKKPSAICESKDRGVLISTIYHEDIFTTRDPEKMQQLGEWEEGNLTAALDKNLLSRFTAYKCC